MTEKNNKYLVTVSTEDRLLKVFDEFKMKINDPSYSNINQLQLLFKGKNIAGEFMNNEKVSSLTNLKFLVIDVKRT